MSRTELLLKTFDYTVQVSQVHTSKANVLVVYFYCNPLPSHTGQLPMNGEFEACGFYDDLLKPT